MILFFRWKRWVAGFVFLVLLSVILTCWIGRMILVKSLPELSGEIMAEGIRAPAEVFRDDYGVAHITADNEHDLMFIEGYIHAQDRLWQMDFFRRAATGQLSEVFGSRTLPLDKIMRTIGIHRSAAMIADSMDRPTLSLLQSYCDGINHFQFTHADNLPDEFVLSGYTPRHWEAEHCIAISRMVAWMLNMAWYVDLTYDGIIDSVGYRKAREIFPDRSSGTPAIVPGWKFKNRSLYDIPDTGINQYSLQTMSAVKAVTGLTQLPDIFFETFGFAHLSSGSNNWVIHGRRTIHGKPLIANDPHLAVMLPSLWYEIHLSGGEFDVSGFGIPGLPFVIIGNNRNIAWGFTNGMLDETDLYGEIIKDKKYLFNGLWKPLKKITEQIAVLDSDTVSLNIYSTHRGPVISDLVDASGNPNEGISIKWIGLDFSDEFRTFSLINRAKSWNDFRYAATFYRLPGQNTLYADVEGNIGYLCLGSVPIRRKGDYFTLLNGVTGQYDWKGYINPDEMPFLYNPDNGFIATANNPIVGEQRGTYLSAYWEPDSRIRRIQQLIESKNRISMDDCRDFQLDCISIHATDFLPYLLKACSTDSQINPAHPEPKSLNIYQEAYLLLKHWNGEMSAESRPAVIFNNFMSILIKKTFHDEMGDSLFRSFVRLTNIPIRAAQSIIENGKSEWWDNLRTPGYTETRDYIIRDSFLEAVDGLIRRSGKTAAAVSWKEFHSIKFTHPFGSIFPLNHYFNKGPFPVSGNATTVNKTEYDFASADFVTTVSSTFRRIVDLKDIQTSYSAIPAGQSGQAMSPFYFDQFQLWTSGRLKTVDMRHSSFRSLERHLIFYPDKR